MCMGVLSPCMSVHCVKSRRGNGSPGTGVIDNCEVLWSSWESNLSLLEEAMVSHLASPHIHIVLKTFGSRFTFYEEAL